MTKTNLYFQNQYVIRKAKSCDIGLIIFLIFKARLDPTQMRWQQFLVIEYHGRLIAFGQIRNYYIAQELGSLYVAPNFRNQGLGSFLVENLVNEAIQPLYLKCVKRELIEFYIKCGFTPVLFEELPCPLKFKFRLSHFRNRFFNASVIFMKYAKNKGCL
ncbi:GNAT family N-acetyltransferase [Nostoc sp. FACHB-87]|uniref:GNAT family N-acetyltransferase n=1 Tax=Nostocales TaxID=1161 RepID=UPI0016882C3F|nr:MULTISPECIES: GNAT family N-acetyltransferase [Nostocales]MBD2303498.1 GNAT family N-acetyltransferase [Nostoc sp. FACHB-190]MBD2458751.1 GNAT family N-acetyltransferase [Nostoc sp. FACHB-87]MBD2479790.1 GNAT family N-acetyltransferase [Anabaena sp. FACHB-83]MBD2492159.1 GNAT family N-acetyltransferase [Aulosira sp. FACHB-615]